LSRSHKLTQADYERLAAIRLALRRFVAVTEANARSVGLAPQQHQALLSIKGGYPGQPAITIGDLARHLLIKHHSAVELTERLVRGGLVAREPSPVDRRRIFLSVTPKGEALLESLSEAGLAELGDSSGLLAAVQAAVQRD